MVCAASKNRVYDDSVLNLYYCSRNVKALVKQSNISSNIHRTSMLTDILNRLTTIFSHPTLCLAMPVADLAWSIGGTIFAPKGVAGKNRPKGRGWQKIFPNVLPKILTTLPVITAEPERLFSKLNNTLSAIRSIMAGDWNHYF